MQTDGVVLDLGRDHSLSFTTWAPDRALVEQFAGLPDADPLGVLVAHAGKNGQPCFGGVYLVEGELTRRVFGSLPRWTIEQEAPLTLSPCLVCPECGDFGWVRNNRWQVR